jgi:hypothetical protein
MVTNHPAAPTGGGQHERWGSHVPDTLHQAITLIPRVATEDIFDGSYGTAFSFSSVNSNPEKDFTLLEEGIHKQPRRTRNNTCR